MMRGVVSCRVGFWFVRCRRSAHASRPHPHPEGIAAEALFFPGLPQTKGPVTLAEWSRVTYAVIGHSGGATR